MHYFQNSKSWIILSLALLLIGCSSSSTPTGLSSDANINSFRLKKNTTLGDFSGYQFTINDLSGLIYNTDSLPYGVRIDSLYPYIKFASSYGYVLNDTLSYSPSENVYMNFSTPVKITNFAADQKTQKTYTIKVNKHQVEAYKFVWNELNKAIGTLPANQKIVILNDKFYVFANSETKTTVFQSDDAIKWTEMEVNGLPNGADVRHILTKEEKLYLVDNQYLYTSSDAQNWNKISLDKTYKMVRTIQFFEKELWAIVQENTVEAYHFAKSKDGVNWEILSPLPVGFPIVDFGVESYQPKYGKAKMLVVGGVAANGDLLSSRWSTENGEYWVNLHYTGDNFEPLLGAELVHYGNRLYLFGGMNGEKQLLPDTIQIRVSNDDGMSWKRPDTALNKLPEAYQKRAYISGVVGKDKKLYLFGGKTESVSFNDVWATKVNFLDFDGDISKY